MWGESMIIEAKELTKDYAISIKGEGLKSRIKSLVSPEKKIVHAVKNIDLLIDEGELVGYIGPNGAGKSTTIKMISGILTPTSGEIKVCGIDPAKKRIENAFNVGAVFGQKTQLWWDLPVSETFELLRRMYNIPLKYYQKNIKEFMDYLDMGSFMDQAVRQLSLGQRIRAEIAASLLHNPRVLFLDEPTIGLDVNIKASVREFIRKINQERGVTILLTTHDLQDIEQLAKRIIVINHGQIGFDGSVKELADKYASGKHRICFTLQQDTAQVELPAGMKNHYTLVKNGLRVQIDHDQSLKTSDVITVLLQKYTITDIDIQGTRIEEVVKEVYQS